MDVCNVNKTYLKKYVLYNAFWNFASKNYDIVLVDCGPYFNETYSAANEDINDIDNLFNFRKLTTTSNI